MSSSTGTVRDRMVPDAVGDDSGRVARRWRMPWAQMIACLVILVGTAVFLYPYTASWFSQKEQSRVLGNVTGMVGAALMTMPTIGPSRLNVPTVTTMPLPAVRNSSRTEMCPLVTVPPRMRR
ncbi:MAG: hypothetical protein U0P48_11500 [Ancrocorticia sp.]